MSRIVPSPDWFIGIDSFDLCVNGNWLDSITIEVSQSLKYVNNICANTKHVAPNPLNGKVNK